MAKAASALKRVLVGRPMASGELHHTLLPKTIALPVFASDPLSSNAYATQEAMIVLAAAGAAGLSLIFFPIAVAVAVVLAIVISSYRQTVHAYPQGGGAYRVSVENLGRPAGLLAGAALLNDYTMTVAVSVTAGTDAIISVAPGLDERRVAMAIGFIALVTVANLRGAKESGTFFAIPTYGFVLMIYVMLITGFVKCVGGCPQAPSADAALHTTAALTPLLIIRAFAAGTTALTGVEAIADGTPAFRYPQSRNAAATLAIMGTLTISMFLGISWLADATGIRFQHGDQQTVLAQIGDTIFGGGILFYLLQAATAAILVLAANTAYQDFPRLASILATDHFMPKQFMSRGDRLVFSNGVLILALLASAVVWIFDADLNSLIQLYLVGVFISFTLSQTGLTVRFRRLKPPNWRIKSIRSAFGAVVTGIVLLVIAFSKFTHGAWIIMTSIPTVMYLMHSVHRHYSDVAQQLRDEQRRPLEKRPGEQNIVMYVPRLDAATARAVGYVRSIRAQDVVAVTSDRSISATWRAFVSDFPLHVLEGKGSDRKRLLDYVRAHRARLPEGSFITVVIPEIVSSRSIVEIFLRPRLTRMKVSLLMQEGVQVLDVPIVAEEVSDAPEEREPARNHAVVLVSGVHNATLQAIEFAESLRPTSIRAVYFGLDPDEAEAIGNEWLAAGIPYPLEIEAAPFRSLGVALTSYLEQFNADGIDRIVTVVIPEFVVGRRRHQILHGQNALIVKRHLLFQRGTVTASVPYHLKHV